MGKSDYTFRYKVRNWPEYNRALVKRGQLPLWFNTEAVAAWRHPGPFEGRGRPKVYADAAIQCALVLNSVFHLNLRTTQGFLQSIVALMALDLPVPNYSTVSRRQSAVDVRLSVGPTDRPRHVVIDSTGLKIYGAGEWHIRKHRTLRRRTWRKLHLGVDETTKEIVAMDLTASNVHDAGRLSSLLSKTPGSIGQVSADRAYDTGSCYEAVLQHDAIVTILPRRNARCSRDSHPPPWRAMRDTHLRRIRTQGRYEWRKSSGCTRQSVAENAVSRYKAILGVSLSARTVKNQKVEAAIKCAVLNRMWRSLECHDRSACTEADELLGPVRRERELRNNAIGINQDQAPVRQRFTIAHESWAPAAARIPPSSRRPGVPGTVA